MPSRNTPGRSTRSTASTGRTAAEDKLWAALHAHPAATTGHLATHASIGRSTAAKILATWATEGSATRTSQSGSDGRRAADTWRITATSEDQVTSATTTQPNTEITEKAPDAMADSTAGVGGGEITGSDPCTTEQHPAPSSVSTSTDATVPGAAGQTRLGKGALRGLVEDYLTEHPGQQFSPNAIGKALGRSSGAVSNALDKLVADGYAVQTQDKPKRFQAKVIPPLPPKE